MGKNANSEKSDCTNTQLLQTNLPPHAPSRPPARPPAGQLQPCGRFGGHKEGSRSSPSTSISRAGEPLEPLSTLSLGVPTLSMLLSPTCSEMNSTQPPSPPRFA